MGRIDYLAGGMERHSRTSIFLGCLVVGLVVRVGERVAIYGVFSFFFFILSYNTRVGEISFGVGGGGGGGVLYTSLIYLTISRIFNLSQSLVLLLMNIGNEPVMASLALC